MRGLIIRYALQQVSEPYSEGACSDPQEASRCLWPKFLLVEDVVTIGTMHDGTDVSCAGILVAAGGSRSVFATLRRQFFQLYKLCGWTAAIKQVEGREAPQGNGPASTRWYLLGSENDEWVWQLRQDEAISRETVVTMPGAWWKILYKADESRCPLRGPWWKVCSSSIQAMEGDSRA